MSRTITALFDSKTDAEAARTRLANSAIHADRVRIIDQGSAAAGGASGQHEGFWASLKDLFMPEEDRHVYSEGIRRGGYMVAADVDETEADRAIRTLEDSNSVDLDQRQDEWRNQGWGGVAATPQTGAFGHLSGDTQDSATSESSARDKASDRDGGRVVDEQRIPVVEEELRVGKREVERGGARVRSYVREIPVHDQVNLREEHVSVERRPVSETSGRDQSKNGDMFKDRDIEMTETAEEAVIGKEAFVREEVVVRKTADERTQQIDDTVRRTEVDIDEGKRDQDRAAFKGLDTDKPRQGSDMTGDDYEKTAADRAADRDRR